MPISQSRMLALVAAAQDYEQAWAKARRAYTSIADNLQSGRISLDQAWPELDFMFTSQLFLADPENTLKTIATESAHFKAVAKRNVKSAQWQRERRAGRPARTPEEVQERIAAANLKRTLKRTENTPTEPKWINPLPNTDAQQVNADSDLEFDPAPPDEAAKAKILRDLDTLAAQEDYKQQYGPNSKPAETPVKEG